METALQTSHTVRPARLDDARGIYRLLRLFSDNGILLPRPESDIFHSLRDFQVIDDGDRIIACAALMIYTRELGEVRSLAVHPDYQGQALGRELVHRVERDAHAMGLDKLMALTYEVGFFQRLGFQVVEMSELPEKVWGACINCHKFRNCDEIAVLKYLTRQPS